VIAVDLDCRRASLKPVVGGDLEDLAKIRSTPEVARWWQARTPEELRFEWNAALDDGEAWWTIWLDGCRVGFIQAYEEADDDYRHAGIDLYLEPGLHGQRYGREVIESVVRYLFREVGHHRVVIDPTLANEVAVRCYEAVGFTRVGVMREYWYDHVQERWVDGLLMDLLATDLLPFALS
jgi:aminoglycoside 6'-N-acetyltransferase